MTALECEKSGVYAEDFRNIKKKLDIYDEERYRGALVGARTMQMSLDENPMKRELRLEKSHARRNHIEAIECNGLETTDNDSIERAFFKHYEAVFATRPVEEEIVKESFLSKMPQLSDDTKAVLERPVFQTEVQKAIDKLNSCKSLGLTA
ncbi:hypothetical protein HPB51_019526 [Rhipicephalus microplus]|uniref:Uncharacterized protein n=1 Tax=Rhipicephalus microplus TaxID=6941 RepID=A0A9J6F5F3_RHIMP|nr:hypothetical protein HPB51_019526 [Rhipicephalus microplus]